MWQDSVQTWARYGVLHVKPCKITITTFTEKKLCGLFNEADALKNWQPIYVHVWKGLLSARLNLLSVS